MTSLTLVEEAPLAEQARRRRHNRRILVWVARVLTLVVVIGGWQLFTDEKIVDPFFFGKPTGVVTQLKTWIEHGTAYGSIWLQIWVTMQEALLGFVYGVAGGIVFGVLLGQVRFLSDVLGPYIKVIRHVIIPSALTWIIASLHVAFGFAIIGAIVGEILGAQRGLGLVITTSQNTFNPNGVFAAMLIIAVIALTAEGLIAQLEKRLLAW